MPNVTANPRLMSDGTVVTSFVDSVRTSPITYTFSNINDVLELRNTGSVNLNVTAGSNSGVVAPWDTATFTGSSFASIVLSADSDICSFEARAIKDAGGQAAQVISQLPSGFNSGTTTKPTYTQTSIENPPSSGIYDHYISLTGGKVSLFDNATFAGYPKEYDIIDRDIQLVKGPVNYICAKLNGDGTVTYENYTDRSLFNYSNIFPVFTFTADNGQDDFTPVDWDSPGYGLSNKQLMRLVETNRFERVSGFNLSEHGTRNLTLSEGVLYQGVYRNTLPEIDSATYPLAFRYTDAGGNWLLSNVNSYPNTQYDTGTGLATLTDGRYAVLWLLRNISRNHIDVFLGNGDYTIDQAKASNLPNNIPEKFFATSFLVGRLIVLKGAATATTIDSAWVTKFSGSITSDHNSLTGKQGGTTDNYYHSNQAINTTDSPTFAGLTVSDVTTFIRDNADNTKRMTFECSGITPGTTRILTVPDKSGTLAMTSDILAPIYAIRTLSANPDIPNATDTIVPFDNYSAMQGISPYSGGVSILTAGWYSVTINIHWATGNNVGIRKVFLLRNGSDLFYNSVASANWDINNNATTLAYFNPGDTLIAKVYQNSGGSLGVYGNGVTFMHIHRVV